MIAFHVVHRIGLGAAVLRRVWRQRTPRRAAR
jgi:hypothetical protein